MWDAFICHASEDKAAAARPLAEALARRGLTVWFDRTSLHVGDSLRESISDGLAKSRYGIVILSPAFFAKRWPQWELNGLIARQMNGDRKVVLPVWHGLTAEQLERHCPPLADSVAARMEDGLDVVVEQLLAAMPLAKRKTVGPSDLLDLAPVLVVTHRVLAGDVVEIEAVAEEMNLFNAPRLKDELLGLLELGHRGLVLDISTATFVDSTVLGILIGVEKRLRARAGGLVIVTTDENVLKTMEITGLDRLMVVAGNLASGEAKLRQAMAVRDPAPPRGHELRVDGGQVGLL